MPYIRVPKLSGSHPLVLENAVQVKLRWMLNGIECVNVLGGRVGTYVHNQAHANAVGAAIASSYGSGLLRDRMATTTELVSVGIRDLREPNLVEYVIGLSGLEGTGSAQPLPNQLAAVVTLRTAYAGKSFRGRIYFSGADEDQNTATGSIDVAFNSALRTFVSDIQDAMAGEGITHAVLSQKRYANLPPPADVETWPGAVNDVVNVETRDVQWDTQRRRRD